MAIPTLNVTDEYTMELGTLPPKLKSVVLLREKVSVDTVSARNSFCPTLLKQI